MALVRGSSRREKARPDIRHIEPMCSWTVCGEVIGLTQGSPPVLAPRSPEGARKLNRRGSTRAGRGQRVADPRLVLMSRGLRSLVTVWRRKPRGPEEEERWSMWRENPPLMTVNAHPRSRQHCSAPPQEGQPDGSQPGCGKSWTRDDGGDSDEPT